MLLSGTLPGPPATSVGCAIAGWTLAGAGMAVVWPIVLSELGAVSGAARRLSTVTAVTAVTAVSYGGGLVGPALIGYVAAAATLPVALLIPAALAAVVATTAPAVLGALARKTPV